mgnify:CR=1 FL=1
MISKKEVKNTIDKMIDEKGNVIPKGVTYTELSSAILKNTKKELGMSLNDLQKEGYIEAHPTLNDIIITKK